MNVKKILPLLIIGIAINACTSENVKNYSEVFNLLSEAEIIEIPLAGEAAKRKSEISGLYWYNNNLILLPQYPDRFSENGLGKIFFLKKEKIDNFLSGKDKTPLQTDYYTIDLQNISGLFQLGSGFEAITINKDTAYFSIESLNNGRTESYVIFGIIDPLEKKIVLDNSSLTLVQSKLFIHNLSNETILFYKNEIIPVYEANGKNVNPKPEVSVFNNHLQLLKKISFPNIEYRITDATSVDEKGKFWAINYLYPGEINKLKVDSDPLIKKYGIGKTHIKSKAVERLVEFQYFNDEIEIVKRVPIYLQLIKGDSRNWEGLVRYNGAKNGFLLATDKFPKTILAFVKYP